MTRQARPEVGVTSYPTVKGPRWRVQLRRTDPRTGRPLFHSAGGFLDMDSANKRAREVLAQWDQDIVVAPSRLTICQLTERFLERVARRTVRASTLHDYEATCRTHICGRRLGKRRAQQVRKGDVEAWVDELLRASGVRSTQLALDQLKRALTWAVGDELLLRNVADGVARPKRSVPERQALSVAQSEAFLTLAEQDPYWPIWNVYLKTGLRLGEGLGLRWADLDLDQGFLWVRQQVVRFGTPERLVVQEPKTAWSRRKVPLDPFTMVLLEEHQERQERIRAALGSWWLPHDLVFCTGNGQPLNPDAVSKHFRALRAQLRWERAITCHTLRHSHASQLIQRRVPLPEIARRLGHRDASVTLRLYAHWIEEDGGAAVDALKDLYQRDNDAPLGLPPGGK